MILFHPYEKLKRYHFILDNLTAQHGNVDNYGGFYGVGSSCEPREIMRPPLTAAAFKWLPWIA